LEITTRKTILKFNNKALHKNKLILNGMKKYFPILLSKAGELCAISNLSQSVKNDICPVIQVLTDHYENVESTFSSWNFPSNQLFLDFSLSNPFNRKSIKNLIQNLFNEGVNIIPVVQENSNPHYITLLHDLLSDGEISSVCLRFSNSSGVILDINNQISALLTKIGVARNQASLLLDYGFVDSHNYNSIATLTLNLLTSVNNINDYQNVIVASGSFLENLTSLSPAGRTYRLPRLEWNIWQILQGQPNLAEIINYGDYGAKYPYNSEANFQGSCSIKYTLPTEFLVYRGEISSNHPQGNGQYITFADQLIRSIDYYGNTFSWGNERIDFYGGQTLTDPKRKTGNAKSWVEISQNHHITLLASLL